MVAEGAELFCIAKIIVVSAEAVRRYVVANVLQVRKRVFCLGAEGCDVALCFNIASVLLKLEIVLFAFWRRN